MPTTIEKINSLHEFIKHLESVQNSKRRLYFYRGHSETCYDLEPSLFRDKENMKEERNIFRELVSLHPNEFSQDRTVFEQLVRMQHFSLPTRLLDLTYNPLVGLYFACKEYHKKDAHLVRLSLSRSAVRYFDSDTVSCISNLSNLTGKERNLIRVMSSDEEFNDSGVGEKLLHFIKSEKPYFLPKIKLDDLKRVVVVKPKLNNRRILSQHGAFLLFGLNSILKEKNKFHISIKKYLIPAKSKKNIINELDKININDSTMFQEIEYSARYISKKLYTTHEVN